MATTPRWGLTYPEKFDRPEGWLQLKTLTDQLELALGHALEVADAAARTALGTAIGAGGAGLTVLQVDTGQPYMWLGASWLALGGSGGGGGGNPSRVRASASTAQPIPNGVSTEVAFGNDTESHADWTKVTRGAGHGFRANRAGVLRGATTVRYASTTASGVRDIHVRVNSLYVGSSGGGAIAGQNRHHTVPILPVAIAEDDEVWVDAFNGTGAERVLEPNSGAWVQISLELA